MKTNKQMSGFTPAAIGALARGDLTNAFIAMTPGGIEAQEKAGQLEQAAKQTLPLELGQCRASRGTIEELRKPWEDLGFRFGPIVDEIFTETTFPVGWKKVPTSHDMWTDIVDDKGRKRGAIFYKAAFYDRCAHARLECRFQVIDDYASPAQTVSVFDASGVVEFKVSGLATPDWSNRAEADIRQANIDEARQMCLRHLANNFPQWESPTAYWDRP